MEKIFFVLIISIAILSAGLSVEAAVVNFKFNTTPEGASIIFEGNTYGPTPYTIDIDITTATDYTITFQKSGYQDCIKTGTVSPTPHVEKIGCTLCTSGSICLPNPLDYDTFGELIDAVVNFIFVISLALAPLMVVIAGFYLLTAGGNPANIKKAQTIIIWTAVGLLVVLLAKGLIAVITAVIGVNP